MHLPENMEWESQDFFAFFPVQAVPSSSSSSPVTPRGTSSFRSLVGRVRGVGLGGLDPMEMQSPNKTKYGWSESQGAGLKISDHSLGEHTSALLNCLPQFRQYLTLDEVTHPGQIMACLTVWAVSRQG